MGLALVVNGTSEAEVAKPGVELGVQHDVAGLEVTVDHHLVVLIVDVMQRRRHPRCDLVTDTPAQRRIIGAAVQVVV